MLLLLHQALTEQLCSWCLCSSRGQPRLRRGVGDMMIMMMTARRVFAAGLHRYASWVEGGAGPERWAAGACMGLIQAV